jgi:deoxyribodipyrimidine photo-lyase
MKKSVNIFWFRRDLRLTDNAGLYHALKSGQPVLPLFIFDRNILDELADKKDARVEFIYDQIKSMHEKLIGHSSGLEVYYGKPAEVFEMLTEKYKIEKVFTNEDYEPYARDRDAAVEELLKAEKIAFHSYKDQVIFSKNEVLKPDDSPYTVYTPYSNRWKSLMKENEKFYLKPYPVEKYFKNLFIHSPKQPPTLKSMGFYPGDEKFPSAKLNGAMIKAYDEQRDFPGLDATSRMGIHLRFGTISIRQLVSDAMKLNAVYLNELIWREFYQMILWFFPQVGRGRTFKPAYENIKWINDENQFALWCEGKTGYPMVDAGMRQLNEIGFMHNRVRMVTASFLSKHLLIDWRWGEAYFAAKLLDYDLASNNGGWQWAAGSGCDAAPYFRVFNPALQQEKFDPDGTYIKRWLPDYQELNYPAPIVEHGFARDRAIRVYKQALSRKE